MKIDNNIVNTIAIISPFQDKAVEAIRAANALAILGYKVTDDLKAGDGRWGFAADGSITFKDWDDDFQVTIDALGDIDIMDEPSELGEDDVHQEPGRLALEFRKFLGSFRQFQKNAFEAIFGLRVKSDCPVSELCLDLFGKPDKADRDQMASQNSKA